KNRPLKSPQTAHTTKKQDPKNMGYKSSMNETQNKIYRWALRTSKTYRRVEVELLDVLQQVEDARVHEARGYPSLFAFATHELKLSEAVAYHLITVARAAKKNP